MAKGDNKFVSYLFQRLLRATPGEQARSGENGHNGAEGVACVTGGYLEGRPVLSCLTVQSSLFSSIFIPVLGWV